LARIARQETGVVEVTGVRRDGTTFPTETESRAIKYRGRDARVVTMEDISAHQEKRALEAQLRHAAKMDSIGRLAGGIAHDFNNLLTVINGYGDVLLSRVPDGDPLQPHVKAIRAAGERAAELTGRLLMMSRRHAVETRPLKTDGLLGENRDLFRRLLGEAVVFEMTLAASGHILADAGQFLQVIMNLVANARDAMPDGGRFTITTATVNLNDLPVSESFGLGAGKCIRIVVADTGPGIPVEVQDRIFEPFFSTKGAGAGTGLGLSIVDGIVRQNGGAIRISNAPGHGAVFTLYFPQLPDESVAATPLSASAPVSRARHGTETVLVVEDQAGVRQLIVETLAGAGFRVLGAAGGGEAVAIAAQHEGPIALLVTDVMMPEMNGPALAQRIVAGRPELRVLFVSGYTDQFPMATVLSGKSKFLAKPFAPVALVATVRAILDEPPLSEA
jgi:signal transduction histidine kinase